jgi:hypothetical protein
MNLSGTTLAFNLLGANILKIPHPTAQVKYEFLLAVSLIILFDMLHLIYLCFARFSIIFVTNFTSTHSYSNKLAKKISAFISKEEWQLELQSTASSHYCS